MGAFLVALATKLLPVIITAALGYGAIRAIGGKDAVKSVINSATGADLTGAQTAQNEFAAQQAEVSREFNAAEAEKAREFNAAEADKARAFQMEMDSTKYQRTISDMRAAGVNPMLMMGGQSVSGSSGTMAASGPAATSAAAAGGLAGAASMSELIGLMSLPKQLKLLDAEVSKTKAEERNIDASTDEIGSRTSLNLANLSWLDKLNQSTLDDINSAIDRREVQNALDRQGISESEAREQLALNQSILAAIDAQSRERLNDLAVQLREAELSYTEAKEKSEYQSIAESKARISHIAAQIDELYQRAIMEAAQASAFDTSTWNNLVENDILHYDLKSRKFEVDHQKADRNWRIATQVISSVGTVVGAGASVYTAGSVGAMARARTAAGAMSGLWLPSSGATAGTSYRYH